MIKIQNGSDMNTIHLEDFLCDGILKESAFREKIKETDWSTFSNKKVLIKGCSSTPIPTWAYLIVTAQLSQVANQILYGESCSAINIFKKT